MANGTGTATIDFGAGNNEASVVVSGLTSISATSKAEAFLMGDSTTSDHTASDHRYFNILVGLTCGTPVAGTGFTIYGTSTQKLSGTYLLNYVWAD